MSDPTLLLHRSVRTMLPPAPRHLGDATALVASPVAVLDTESERLALSAVHAVQIAVVCSYAALAATIALALGA